MILNFALQKDSREIILRLRHGKKIWEEKALQAEDIIPSLDKIIKRAKIDHSIIKSVTLTCPKTTSLTSFRLAKTVQQALAIILDKA